MQSRIMFVLVCSAFCIFGCVTPPGVNDPAVNTPRYYSENRMFYLRKADSKEKQSSDHTVELVTVHEVLKDERESFKAGDPIAVVIRGVRLPENLPGGSRDIAVILDVDTGANQGVESMVVHYQRDVPKGGGQLLNFADMLVYSNREWDGLTPPWFRVRVLDVAAERNTQTAAVLESVSKIGGEISGLVPHPIVPIVTRAIDAAGRILANGNNETILDFQVNLFGADQTSKAGDATLAGLYTGEWFVLGRQIGKSSESWSSPIRINRRTGQIVAQEDAALAIDPKGQAPKKLPQIEQSTERLINVEMPYVQVAILKTDVQVPKIVMDRSETLIKLLSSASAKSQIDTLGTATDSLVSAIRAYAMERQLAVNPLKADLQELVDLLIQDSDESSTQRLGPAERRQMIKLFNSKTGQSLGTSAEVIEWWEKGGGKNGSFSAEGKWVITATVENPETPAPTSQP